MARPVKKRFVCKEPRYKRFLPFLCANAEVVTLSIEEYETVRLIDHVGLTQEDAASHMNLTRTSVTALYGSARQKIADCLVNGKELMIDGGNYELCSGKDKCSACGSKDKNCCNN